MANTAFQFHRFGFDAARRSDQYGLHGHSFACELLNPEKIDISRLKTLQKLLNNSDLKESIKVESDVGIARLIAAESGLDGTRGELKLAAGANRGVLLTGQEVLTWRRYRFEAAHYLPNVPEGHKCGRLHGHGFEVSLLAAESSGQQIDDGWQPLSRQLDGHCLNRIEGLENPTSEVLAQWLWHRLIDDLPELRAVDVRETVSAGCRFDGSHHYIWKQQDAECALEREGFDEPMGHSYTLRLHLSAPLDEVMGWTQDYGDVKARFQPLYRQLDHHCLNRVIGDGEPSDAAVAQWLRLGLGEALPALQRIDVLSTPHTGAVLDWGALARAPRLVI
ncbi:MAG: 6-pyruvoyl trahydropterin synthase family protein [Pseudomonadota bacterium]